MQPEKYARRTNTLIFKDLSLQLLFDYLRTSRRHFWENMVPTIPLFLFPLVNASLIFLSENSVSIATVWMSWESKVINVLTRNKTQTNIMNKMKEKQQHKILDLVRRTSFLGWTMQLYLRGIE